MIHNNLGGMKDELNGHTIDAGYFFGLKKYAYHYKTKDSFLLKTRFSGVTNCTPWCRGRYTYSIL